MNDEQFIGGAPWRRKSGRARVHHRPVECSGCRKQMINALRQAIPNMLHDMPKLVAELVTEGNEAPDHVH
jgi:hypothetical protein